MGQRLGLGDHPRQGRHRQFRDQHSRVGLGDADQHAHQRIGGEAVGGEDEQHQPDALRGDHVEQRDHQHRQRAAVDARAGERHQQEDFQHQQRGEQQRVGRQFAHQAYAEGLGPQDVRRGGAQFRRLAGQHMDHGDDHEQL